MLKIYDKFEKEIWSTKEGEGIWSWWDKRIRFTEPLIGAFISRQSLSGLLAPCFTLHKGALDNVLFSDADLSRSKWSECSMECINFMDTKLEQSLFRESELHSVFFIRAKLSGALFDYSRFTNVIFASASLDGALFIMDEALVPGFIHTCNFENADLRGCLVNKTEITELIKKYKGN